MAGNDVSIFLFRFELRGDGIDFVLNEAIAGDMYPDVDEKLRPLVHACSETLLRYKRLSVSDIIMDGSFLVEGGFEVMLSKGLGRHFPQGEKDRLFQDAKNIADLLASVMDRRTQELQRGEQLSQPPKRSPSPRKVKEGLGELGRAKHQQVKSQWLADGWQPRPGLKQLRPEDLPPDVTASSGYDHRGLCYVFEHKKLGELGRIVLSQVREQKMLLQAEIHNGRTKPESATAKKKREIFEKVVATVSAVFNPSYSAHSRDSETTIVQRIEFLHRSGVTTALSTRSPRVSQWPLPLVPQTRRPSAFPLLNARRWWRRLTADGSPPTVASCCSAPSSGNSVSSIRLRR